MTKVENNRISAYEKESQILFIHKEAPPIGDRSIKLEKGASLKWIVINEKASTEEVNYKFEVTLEEDARLEIINLYLGEGNSKNSIVVYLKGDGSRCDLKSGYLISGETAYEMNYDIFHQGKRTVSNVIVKGALQDKATKNFNGNLHFKKGAKAAKGSEVEDAILLSPKAVSHAVPALWCEEEDIIGNHAASSGKLSQEKIFYLMSRGLSEEQAKSLMVEAALQPILDTIEDKAIREKLSKEIGRRIGK